MSTIEADRPSQGTVEMARLGGEPVQGWAVEVQDDSGSRRVAIAGPRVTAGSGAGAEVVVRDAAVSARHVALLPSAYGVGIEDLGSKNGTFVGGARVAHARGDAGTTIVIGRSSLTLRPIGTEDTAGDDGEPLASLAGGSTAMRRIAARVRRFASHRVPVLVLGESGTGKELVARALHSEGARKKGPFVAINVASLPRELVESEFFGHERGAFTGAVARRAGAFHEADGGTLFLDEIGEMPLDAQPKLLRALDGYDVRAVGATGKGRAPDVRIVAATNRALGDRVNNGEFRLDLFHRLSVFQIELPALRERRGDIGPIARAILASAPPELACPTLTSRALARLVAYEWPGNVRELRSVLYRAADLASGAKAIEVTHIDEAIGGFDASRSAPVQRSQARAFLQLHKGNVTAAARAAGLPRTTFRKRLAEESDDE